MEETHYYPFGLTMAGISSKALNFGNPENKKKYNDIEFENDFELNFYDAQFRELDGQIGRWWQIDPVTDGYEHISPYASMYNNPITISDPLGDEGEGCCKGVWKAIKDAYNYVNNSPVVVWINNNLNPLVPAAELITGRSLNSNFTESKPRLESATQLATFVVPTAKAETIVASEVKNVIVGQVEKQVVKNAAKGEAFEKTVLNSVEKAGEKDISKQITIKANNGVKTKVDIASRTESGTVKLREAKASETAPLTKNQKSAHPSIEQSGGVVVGKGKPGFPGGTKIPPTKVEIVRPKKINE